MTNPTGRSFISYRRTRSRDIERLIAMLRNRGIPTWQDIEDLDYTHTETELRRTLQDDDIANAILWITPEVADSSVIKRVEAPAILRRSERDERFFVIPVAAGNLDYAQASDLFDGALGLRHLQQWNMMRIASDPLSEADAAQVAVATLRRRLRALHHWLPPAAPLTLQLLTRQRPAAEADTALRLDWTAYFSPREAQETDWRERLLPALEDVAQAIEREAPERGVVAYGLPSLPAALALGVAFIATRNRPLTWRQQMPGAETQSWSLTAAPEPSGFEAEARGDDTDAEDLAVLLSVTSNVELGFANSKAHLPAFRATLNVTKPGDLPHAIATPGEARDLADLVQRHLLRACADFYITGKIHLFLAAPAGLAVMIGQLLNRFGPVQTYEYLTPTGAIGHYQPAVLLHPSG